MPTSLESRTVYWRQKHNRGPFEGSVLGEVEFRDCSRGSVRQSGKDRCTQQMPAIYHEVSTNVLGTRRAVLAGAPVMRMQYPAGILRLPWLSSNARAS